MTQNDPLIGKVIADRYEVLELLGAGGMGRVYLAEHVRMGRRCAVKVMSPSLAVAADAISRFHREAANASRINHPNVAQIYDFGETDDGTLYLAMELIEGETLTRIIEREGPLSIPRAAAMTKQIADALGAAHHLDIVHRDLKPENVMVARQLDGSDWVKVVDFGIAKTTQEGNGGSQTVTTVGVSLGTPEYMSPEQLAGEKLDRRSDIYALGLVFFHMLTADLPYPRVTSRETLVNRLTSRPRTLAEVRPQLPWPSALQRALDRALAPDADERYGSAVDFGRDVLRAAELVADPDKTVRLEPVPVARAKRRTERPEVIPEEPETRSAWRALIPIAFAIALLAAAAEGAQRYPKVADRLSAHVAELLPARMKTAVLQHAFDSSGIAPRAVDSVAPQRAASDSTVTPARNPDSVTAVASQAALTLLAPHDSVVQQGTPAHVVPPKDTTTADTTTKASRPSAPAAAPAHVPAAPAPAPTTNGTGAPPVTSPAPDSAARMRAATGALGQHNWLRANGDSGAAQPLATDASEADRLVAVGKEIEGHIQRADREAGRMEFAGARQDYVAAARELAVVREFFPGAPAVVQLQRSLAQGVRSAYDACVQIAPDSATTVTGFRCENLMPRRPNQNRTERRMGPRDANPFP